MSRVVRGRTKRCVGDCRLVKPLDEFYRNRGGKGGRESRCIPCFRASYTSGGPCARRDRDGKPACGEERALGQRYCERHKDMADSKSLARLADKALRAVIG